jgi:hypothetical protein
MPLRARLLLTAAIASAVCLGARAPAPSHAAPASGPFFSENFDGTSLDAGRWTVSNNGYPDPAVSVAGGYVQVGQLGVSALDFPFVTSPSGLFPPAGDFETDIAAQYTSVGGSGDGLTIVGSGGELVFELWNDSRNSSGPFAEIPGSLTEVNQPTAPHTYRLVVSGSMTSLFVDGSLVSSTGSAVRPDRIWFGHPTVGQEGIISRSWGYGEWTTFRLDSIRTSLIADPVVVLVHGYDQNSDAASCGMADMQSALDGKGFKTECLWYRTRDGVNAGANELLTRIAEITSRPGVDKVDIVAHSEGGLVARFCIQFFTVCRNHVRSLTMIGTPNLGTRIATAACNAWSWAAVADGSKYDQGACDMVPGNAYLLGKLNASPAPPAGISYRVLMGDLESVASHRYFGEPSDCVVPVSSAFGVRAVNPLSFPHDDLYAASHVKVGAWCLSPGEMDFADIQKRVRDLLSQSNGLAFAAVTSNGMPNAPALSPNSNVVATPTEPPASAVASHSGVIQAGVSVDLQVAVPASQTAGTFVFRAPDDPSAALTFALLRIEGTPVATNDGDVTYERGIGFGGLAQTQYTIMNPAAGTWTMRVTGTTVPLTGWPYDLQALVPGGISVTASTGAGHYDVGQSIALSADVAANATPFAGATVNATITKPDNTTAALALADAGGGAYTGSFDDTAACGLYQVTISADGSDGGTPFSRQDRTIAFVGVPGNVIMDPCNADSDGDGITDKDEINIYHTNPANPYTAGDGYTDGQHVALGKNPLTYCNIMRADINGDGAVNALDLATLAASFSQQVPPAPERVDQNADGLINALDLAEMATVFTQPVTACP